MRGGDADGKGEFVQRGLMGTGGFRVGILGEFSSLLKFFFNILILQK